MRDGLTYQGNDHWEAIEQLFEINKILPHMCEVGSKFDGDDFPCNIIVVTLHEKARVEFIMRDGRNLRDEDDVLDLLEEIQDGIEAEMELKHANRRRNNSNFKNDDDATSRDKDGRNVNMCPRKATTTLGTSVQTILAQKIISTATSASAGTHIAKTDLGTMLDGVRNFVTIILMKRK